MFVCKFCHAEFDTDDELVDHLTDEHDAFSAVTFMEVDIRP